jgi:1,4-dihydroxy-2-naphthoate octaprenyltransferase
LGTYYVQVESLSVEVFLASLAMGSFACAILVLNNLRDREKDEIAGKRTLAVIIGDSGTRDLYRWLLFSTLTIAAILIFYSFYFLIALCALPLAARLVRAVKSGTSDLALIPLLAATGRLQIIYSFLISLAALLMSR